MDDPDGTSRDRLRDLLGSAQECARSGDEQAAAERLASAEAVAETELEDPLGDRLAFGCRRASAHLGDDPVVATEYLRAMERLLGGNAA